jgi:hypothetical protein
MIEIADAPSPPGPGLKFEGTPRILRNGEIYVDFAATVTTVDKDHRRRQARYGNPPVIQCD